jgi:hypothetical protein
MKAQASLGVLLVLELLATGYMYGSGSRFPVYLLLTAFLPVTALLFFATSCQLDKYGKLRRDTIAFKIISFCRPEARTEDKLQLCPTFWMMIALLLAFGFMGFISFNAIWVLATKFKIFAYLFFGLMFVISYVMVAVGVIQGVEEKTDGHLLNLPLLSALAIFFFICFFASLLYYCQPEIRSFQVGISKGSFVALYISGAWFAIWTAIIGAYLGIRGSYRAVAKSAIPVYFKSAYTSACPVIEISPKGKKVPRPVDIL